jgi:hypothetical protein
MNLGSIVGLGCICRPFPAGLTTDPEWWSPAEVRGSVDVDRPDPYIPIFREIHAMRPLKARSHVLGYAPGPFGEKSQL